MRKLMSCLLPAAIVALSATACFDVPEEQHTSYETLTLHKQSIEIPVSWSATIVGKNDVVITPKTSGQLMEVRVSTGQTVKKGQVLFVIDQREAKLDLNNAEADLQAAVAAENTAYLEYESTKNLYEKKIVSSYLLNTALNDYDRAKAAVAQAKAAVAAAQINLEYCTITAPVSGMVGDLPLNQGVVVSPVDELTTISGNKEMTAKFSLTETQVNNTIASVGSLDKALELMPPVTLFLKDGTEYAHKGKATSVSGVVDQFTGSVECRVTFPNPEGSLYSGIQGTVQMPFDYDDVIIIPLTAVVRIQDKVLVQKVNSDNTATTTVVTIEEVGNGKDAILVSGLDEGDTIVAKGAANVVDGQQVIFPEENKATK